MFFISLLAYTPSGLWAFGKDGNGMGIGNVASIGLVSAIIQWSMHYCMGIE